MLIIGKKSIEERVRREKEINKSIERLNNPSSRFGPQRGDFELSRRLDKTLGDLKKFKNPKDRKKINQEYYGLQMEYRKNHKIEK